MIVLPIVEPWFPGRVLTHPPGPEGRTQRVNPKLAGLPPSYLVGRFATGGRLVPCEAYHAGDTHLRYPQLIGDKIMSMGMHLGRPHDLVVVGFATVEPRLPTGQECAATAAALRGCLR